MFQTEPILYLQSVASDLLTFLMVAITHMGYEPFYVGLICFIILGVSFRKGFLLLQLFLWQGVINDILKDFFALPRPVDVDSNIQHLGKGRPNTTPFSSMGAKGFFETLDRQVVEYFRLQSQNDGYSFGFPSGHVQGTTTLWGGMSLLFRNRTIRWITPLMIVLMALSRMCLGRHFLADVVGGAAVGGIILLVFHQLYVRWSLQDQFFERANFALGARLTNIIFPSFMIFVPLLLLPFYPDKSGVLIGINAGFLLVMLKGVPNDSGTLPKRTARVLLGVILFSVTSFILDLGIDLTGIGHEDMWIEFIEKAIPSFMIMWGSVTISVKLGLYKRETVVGEEGEL